MWSLYSSDPNVLPYSSPPEPLGQQAQEPVLALVLSYQHYFSLPRLLQILIWAGLGLLSETETKIISDFTIQSIDFNLYSDRGKETLCPMSSFSM